MSAIDRFRQFKPPGAVSAAFLQDTSSVVRGLMGPVGCGKTVTCIFDHLKNASAMPVCTDGIIRFRLATIGQTYGQIERNLFPSWKDWLPEDGGDWTEADFVGGGGRHAVHSIKFDVLRGGRRVQVQFEAIFAAIGENSVEQFMRGFEPTAFWLYEMDLLPAAVLDQAIFRLGRYPAQRMLPPGTNFRSYVIGDYNAPDIDSWCYDTMDANRPDGYALYRCPSGRSPQAENLSNLPKGYYDRQVAVLSAKSSGRHLVRRYVDAQYGPSLDGQPVYPEYSDEFFLAPDDFGPVDGIEIGLGVDAGLGNPAGVLGQVMPDGQWRIFAEIVPGRMSAKRFAAEVKKAMADFAPGRDLDYGFGDPAGFMGADKEDDEFSWCEQVMNELGITIEPAPSNAILLRLDAVRDELVIEGGIPRLWLSRRCRKLRKGFASHYCYKLDRKTGSPGADAKPHKGDYSHVHDALQYLMLGRKGRYGTINPPNRTGPGEQRRLSLHSQARSTVLKSNTLSGR